MLKNKITLWVALFTLLLTGCRETEEKCVFIPDTSNITVDLSYHSLVDSMITRSSKQELVDLLGRHVALRDYFFKREGYPSDSVFINTLYSRFTNPHMDTLRMEISRVFGDESNLKKEFADAFRNLKYYYPDFVPPSIETTISGLDTDLFVTDSLIIVSLDYFLGAGAKYRPTMYEYLLRQYVKENIVPSCMLIYGIDSRLNKTSPSDKTVLADMIAYGKAYYFARQMVPCTPDSTFIWYTAEEIEGSKKNQDLIWARFIEDQVLYSTSHVVKQKYLSERPKTVEVGEQCPGRIAQWVGWEIVKKYMKTHPDVTLPDLMKNENADEIFKESRYKPEKQ